MGAGCQGADVQAFSEKAEFRLHSWLRAVPGSGADVTVLGLGARRV